MIGFDPSEEQALMRDSVAAFAAAVLTPAARRHEEARAVPDEVRRAAHELGLGVMALPDSVGGHGQGWVTRVLIEEELGAADAGAAFALPGPGFFGTMLMELGSTAQIDAFLSGYADDDAHDRFGAVAFSEPAPCRERAGLVVVAEAVDGGYVLRGDKAFVNNAAAAQRFVVFAQVDAAKGWDGMGAFVVGRDAKGVTVGARHATLGLDTANFAALKLDEVRVSEDARLRGDEGDEGFVNATLRAFAKHALVSAARALGVARTAYDMAREYGDTRVAFGKPIGHFQAVAFTLADRLMDVESSRWLLWRAAAAWDAAPARGSKAERAALLMTARAVAQTFESAMRCADDCVSLHGGAGFIRDLLAEKLMRDAKTLALTAPTPEHMDQLATALEMGGRLDPATALPTPDTQAIFT